MKLWDVLEIAVGLMWQICATNGLSVGDTLIMAAWKMLKAIIHPRDSAGPSGNEKLLQF
jgi:hypothetical protein